MNEARYGAVVALADEHTRPTLPPHVRVLALVPFAMPAFLPKQKALGSDSILALLLPAT